MTVAKTYFDQDGLRQVDKFDVKKSNKNLDLTGASLMTQNIKQNVIDTDYDNYAVIYGCENYNFGFQHETYAILLSRTDILGAEPADKAEQTLSKYNYNMVSEMVNAGERCGFDIEKSGK